ncbi:unnamed protein product [Pseudo-nitzschia multistriata]|uniref:Uncharacterized protein n=1 Tax=Pseudo-nitzschia multistriata TaxID=183589 RepID=A0A448ZPH3_9STRA|nr:unnamed protein product [Pseudo-nitzschia multistriata]
MESPASENGVSPGIDPGSPKHKAKSSHSQQQSPPSSPSSPGSDPNSNSKPNPSSLPGHLSEAVAASFLDPAMDVGERLARAEAIRPFLNEIDGYWSFGSYNNSSGERTTTEGRLPPLAWNAHFRKAYTLLLWVRPVIGAEKEPEETETTTVAEDDAEALGEGTGSDRLLYRFAEGPEDATSSTGVSVSVGEWRALETDENACSEPERGSDRSKQSTNHKRAPRTLLTTLRAHSLPHEGLSAAAGRADANFDPAPFVVAPLELPEGEWSMIGITHVFPYLKRPHWTVCVNGRACASGELAYPQPSEAGHKKKQKHRGHEASVAALLGHNTLFRNVCGGGCEILGAGASDCSKTASDLQKDHLHSTARPKHHLSLHLATFLLAGEVFTPTVQALLAQAGPAMALQSGGGLPRMPPVANWTKGSSLEGVHVGIPLVVHGQSLRVQQLGASCALWGSAVDSRVTFRSGEGPGGLPEQTIICTMPLPRGATHGAPRVGLIQPTPPAREQNDPPRGYFGGGPKEYESESEGHDPVSLLIVGSGCSIHHNLSDYLLSLPTPIHKALDPLELVDSTSKLFSVLLLQGQSLDACVVLPFFLSLPPPGTRWNLQLGAATDSLQHLFALYSSGAAYAACLIRTLAASVRTGGGRWHEELLQNGTVHVLASSLRQSLVRSEFLGVVSYATCGDLVRAKASEQAAMGEHAASGGSTTTSSTASNPLSTTMDLLPVSPRAVPEAVTSAVLDLIDACCGPPSEFVEDLSPAKQIQRTSDLALTCLFGLALDWDLWGEDPLAASSLLSSVAQRYGGTCVTSGHIVRSQVSVQYFLDTLKYKLHHCYGKPSSGRPRGERERELRSIGVSCGDILEAMLLSSLSSDRSVSQGEHDVSACMGALSECPMDSICARVVFRAIGGILEWCEIVPPGFVDASSGGDSAAAEGERVSGANESDSFPRRKRSNSRGSSSNLVDDGHKCKVASRLARNLILSQFHDVIAPMLLSRTVFSTTSQGNKEAMGTDSNHSRTKTVPGVGKDESRVWQENWRICLVIFAWISSIAGPEGNAAANSLGSLLLASGMAGSLESVLERAGESYAENLFLPDPTMAMTVASTLRSDGWSYSDLLSDRLAVMMPLLPSLVVSLLPVPAAAGSVEEQHRGEVPSGESLRVLTEVVTAVTGSFYRVFGGITHSAAFHGSRSKTGNKQNGGDSGETKTARAYVPHLLVVANALEQSLVGLGNDEENKEGKPSILTILGAPAMVQRGADDGTWVEVSSTAKESFPSVASVSMPGQADGESDTEKTLVVVKSCQNSVLTIITELMCRAMKSGGGESSTQLWRSVLGTLKEVESYGAGDSEQIPSNTDFTPVTKNLLCRLLAMVLMRCLKRDYQWELWTLSMSSAVSRLCLLVEEKELLRCSFTTDGKYSNDQKLLMCAFLYILEYGRDTMGWCQLILPTPPVSHQEGNKSSSRGTESAVSAAKIMLPVLQPSLRIILEGIGNLSSETQIVIPSTPEKEGESSDESKEKSQDDEKPVSLLEYVARELRHSLMGAIVGLAFANARDIALHAMAVLRRDLKAQKNGTDDTAIKTFTSLLCMTAEEIRVRYEGERRRRETALVDAYDEQDEEAAADSMAVEKLILGDSIVPPSNERSTDETLKEPVEEISFENDSEQQSDRVPADFLLLNEGLTAGGASTVNRAKMEWSKYEGFSAALQTCSNNDGTPIDNGDCLEASAQIVLKMLSPFLDAWDEFSAMDAVDTELVKLFDLTLGAVLSEDSSTGEALPEMDVFHLGGCEGAADAMTTFIELAASEKNRTMEVTEIFLPNHRNSCSSYTERFCWTRYMGMLRKGNADEFWERGIADGNRDVRSRIVSIPCEPQFRRFIPKYLDNSSHNRHPGSVDQAAHDEETDIDAFTKSLIESGHLEIVDITKKEINEEEKPALELPTSDTLDDDFAETPLDISRPRSADEEDKQPEESVTTPANKEATTIDAYNRDEEEKVEFDKTQVDSMQFNITASAFASPPDNSSSTLGLMHSAAAGLIERHLENCLHVKTEGSRKCSMLLTSTHLILEYDIDSEGLYEGEMMAVREEAERQRMIEESKGGIAKDGDKIQEEIENRHKMTAALRPKSIRWNLSELSHVYLRRYRLRDSSIELFFIPSGGTSFGGYGLYSPSTSLFLDFGPGYEGKTRRDDAAFAIMKRAPPQAIKQWPDHDAQFLHNQLSRLTIGWVEGRITNFDYLLHLNILAGRSYNDTCQYPIMPWVLSNYHSEEIPDLTNPDNFRDLRKPMGALNPSRLEDFIERFNTFADPSIPPFMYGSHYSTNAGVVLHFLVRLHPFAGLHRQLQGGHFDVADRLFSSVPRTWEMCTGSSAAEVKELTPEWYCNPSFLKNTNKFRLGTSQDGELIGDVVLPPWAKGSAEKFIEVMRNALESDICSAMIPDWIDLIFGRKQQGPEAIAAHNVFFYLTYYGSVDVAAIEDEGLRQATELQIAHFGQCPMQLFVRPHVRRVQYVNKTRLTFYQITSAYTFGIDTRKGTTDDENEESTPLTCSSNGQQIFGKPLYLPFFSAPMSHWVHLDAPPPGPHAPLISVRLAGTDRCLAVDAQGVFHCFRWAWKAEDSTQITGFESSTTFPRDNGCFVAQRELPRFRTVPRLVHKPSHLQGDESNHGYTYPAVAISKTLFAGISVLLVLSDGDGRGGLAMQLVDPAKGVVRGEAVVGSIHSSRIRCIATDPIGNSAGHGGVGGELAIVGSSDGTASIWRFMSSHFLPLRPRVYLSGHCSSPIYAVGLSASINVAVTVSEKRLCLYSIGNGSVIRIIEPPTDTLELPEGMEILSTTFVKSPAVAISVQGFVVAVCETKMKTKTSRSVITLHLFSLEGVSLGSKALESWRGIPTRIVATPDGTTVLVCSGRGVTVHRVSAITPLAFIDEWQITESSEGEVDGYLSPGSGSRALDIDLGPSLNRPVIAAAACTNGVLRLHALAGISAYSERHKKVGLIPQGVGSLIKAPARGIKRVFGKASTIGTKAADAGKDISKEISSDVKEKGVTGFLGGMFGRKK